MIKPEQLQEGWVKFSRFNCTEGCIDKWAIEITKKNYPNTIHLGDEYFLVVKNICDDKYITDEEVVRCTLCIAE